MTTPILTADSIEALRRDHERLRLTVERLLHQLRALQSATDLHRRYLVVAELDADLTTSDATVAGTLIAQHGPGPPAPKTACTLHNLGTETAGVWVFEGTTGQYFAALWMGQNNYLLIQSLCPT